MHPHVDLWRVSGCLTILIYTVLRYLPIVGSFPAIHQRLLASIYWVPPDYVSLHSHQYIRVETINTSCSFFAMCKLYPMPEPCHYQPLLRLICPYLEYSSVPSRRIAWVDPNNCTLVWCMLCTYLLSQLISVLEVCIDLTDLTQLIGFQIWCCIQPSSLFEIDTCGLHFPEL